MESADALRWDQVEDVCKAKPEVRQALHRRLNYFENLAAGCKQGVFDEGIVKISLETLFARTLSKFRAYVEHRRNLGGKDMWVEFEALSQSWSSPASPRPLTGSTAIPRT